MEIIQNGPKILVTIWSLIRFRQTRNTTQNDPISAVHRRNFRRNLFRRRNFRRQNFRRKNHFWLKVFGENIFDKNSSAKFLRWFFFGEISCGEFLFGIFGQFFVFDGKKSAKMFSAKMFSAKEISAKKFRRRLKSHFDQRDLAVKIFDEKVFGENFGGENSSGENSCGERHRFPT